MCSRLKTLATALGSDKTANELLPELTELIQQHREEDEALYVLAKSLTTMLDLVGKNYHALCGPFEALATVEETTVRERAVRGLQETCAKMTPAQCYQHMFPLLKRLAEAEWFTPRRSSCGLLAPVYSKVEPSHRQEVLDIVTHLVADETPMVRRAVAASLAGIATTGGPQVTINTLTPIWVQFTDDPHFSVRVAAVNVTGAMIQAMGKDAALLHIIPHVAASLTVSRGWRVRNALATQLGVMAKGLPGVASSKITPLCVQLCRDFEDDVSENALNQLAIIAQAIQKDEGVSGLKVFAEACIPVLEYQAISDDRRTESAPRLRRAVAKATLEFAKIDPQHLGSRCLKMWEAIFLDFKSKESSDVSRTLIGGLGDILKSIGSDLSLGESSKWGKLIRSLYEGSKAKAVDEVNAANALNSGQSQNAAAAMGDALPGDPVETPKWRVRVSVVDNINNLAAVDKAYATHVFASALSDEAFEVRASASTALVRLCRNDSAVGGPAGVAKDFCPLLIQFFKKSQETNSYQQRLGAARAAAALAPYGAAWSAVQQLFLDALKDPVSNVVLGTLAAAKAHPEVIKHVKSEIEALSKSSDQDIRDAAKALL